jgi:hypothetical protein
MMNRVRLALSLFLLFPGLCPSSLVWAQSSASLLVTTDTSCDWKLDGVSQGRLNVDDAKVVKTTAGEHLLQATSADGQLKWQATVTADPSAQKLVKIPLSDTVPTWTDPATGLMWARKDNGGDVTWQQAANYCQNLALGGYSGWRLPTIDELQGIYDSGINVPGQWGNGKLVAFHVKGSLKLSGWQTSSSQGNASGEAWDFDFGAGLRPSYPLGFGHNGRALCVRRSGA